MNPHQVTKDFERELCAYTGAPFAVTVTSCTMALLLAVAWHLREPGKAFYNCGEIMNKKGRPHEWTPIISVPKRTYIGVPYAIRAAGGHPTFRDEDWTGCYQLKPLPVWDSARWFTRDLYHIIRLRGGGYKTHPTVCVSFHASKTLGDTQGGAILHDDPEADAWLRRARFDGRAEGVAPKDDDFPLPRAWHCYLSPDVAARLLWQLSVLPKHNDPLPNDQYPDLSQLKVFE